LFPGGEGKKKKKQTNKQLKARRKRFVQNTISLQLCKGVRGLLLIQRALASPAGCRLRLGITTRLAILPGTVVLHMHGGLDTKHSHRVERCEATKPPGRAQDDDDDPCTLLFLKDTRTLDVVVVVGECSMFVRKSAQAPSSSMLAVCI